MAAREFRPSPSSARLFLNSMVSDSFISGVRSNPGSRVLESLVVSENFSYNDRVIEVSMVEVHIGEEGS
jgi:hypothetical protein